MNLCEEGHEEVCYEADHCPVCEQINMHLAESQALEDKIESLENQVDNMADEISDLEDKVSHLTGEGGTKK